MNRIPEIYRNLEWAKSIADFEDIAFRVSQMNLAKNEKEAVSQYASKQILTREFNSEEIKNLEIEFRSIL